MPVTVPVTVLFKAADKAGDRVRVQHRECEWALGTHRYCRWDIHTSPLATHQDLCVWGETVP